MPTLSEEDSSKLYKLAQKYTLTQFLSNNKNVEEIGIDFVYSSAKLEGNTYTQIETIELLKLGITAGGKLYSDAKMILNLREAYKLVLNSIGKVLDRALVQNVHYTLAYDLLEPSECGTPRKESVMISGTSYVPPVGEQYLLGELRYLLEFSQSIEDPFSKAIYLKLNICYLQHFKDINKRTARMIQTLSLMNNGVMPLLSGYVKSSGYIEAILYYYDTGDYSKYIHWFIKSYEEMINNLAPPTMGSSRVFKK